MTDEDPRIAAVDAMAAELEAASLITVTTREDGRVVYRLTPEGGLSAF